MGKHYKRFLFSLLGVFILAGGLLLLRPYLEKDPTLDYKDTVFYYAWKYDLDPTLVLAVIKTESNFNPNATSSANARGLMQITKDTLKWALFREGEKADYSEEDLYDPEINIRYGCLILSLLKEEFQDTDTALAAYNAGRGNVIKWLKDSRFSKDGVIIATPYRETNQYIKKVNKYHAQYQKMLGDAK
ncbi:MAG: lytic transglycosylase domain-containing protein [Clostridia bacterium]|nr:lytic transglycosylase domain-containing protein [Clostridia bacterium]